MRLYFLSASFPCEMADPFRNFIVVLARGVDGMLECAGDAGGVLWGDVLGDFAAHFWG